MLLTCFKEMSIKLQWSTTTVKMWTPPKGKLLNIHSLKYWANHTLHLPHCFLACVMKEHAICKKFSTACCDVCGHPAASAGCPWLTHPIAATLNSHPSRRSPAAPRFTPYSPDPVTSGSKPRWKLPLRTHPSLAAGASRAWAKAPTLQLPPARLRSPAAAQSRFTFLSDTHRQLRRCPYAKGSFCGTVSKYQFENEFSVEGNQQVRIHPRRFLRGGAGRAPQGNSALQQHSISGQHV